MNSGVSLRISGALVRQCVYILRGAFASLNAVAPSIGLHWKMPESLNKRSRSSVYVRLMRVQTQLLSLTSAVPARYPE